MTKLAVPTNIVSSQRDPIPEGLHDAVICSVQQVSAEQAPSGNGYLRIEYALTDFFMSDGAPATCYGNISFHPDAAWALEQFLKALGLTLEEAPEVDTDDFVGENVRIVTAQREYPVNSGTITTDVNRVYDPNYVPQQGEPGARSDEKRSAILLGLSKATADVQLDPVTSGDTQDVNEADELPF